mmetsp:Transcript_21697/g.29870  ORF Transcript_21697/g.29870 Transcript_21697/m.29870 type:complete len:941 (-) Transcript_21697:1222-4044(-)
MEVIPVSSIPALQSTEMNSPLTVRATSPTSSSGSPAASPSNLLDAVRKQVEYYFSKENLASDSYLVSQMDSSMSVPISVIMKFPKMKSLTQDEAIIRQALETSTSLVSVVENNKLKANLKSSGRSTIILREIPSDTPIEEVKEIFNYDGCKQISSIRSEIGDSWFVSMESEEFAKDTLLDLRIKKRTFRGQPIKARLKTETVVKSYFPVQTAPPITPVFPMMYPGMGMMPGAMPMDLRAFGYGMVPPYMTDMSGMMPIGVPPTSIMPQPQMLPLPPMDAVLPSEAKATSSSVSLETPVAAPVSAIAPTPTGDTNKGTTPGNKDTSLHNRDSGRKPNNKSGGGGNVNSGSNNNVSGSSGNNTTGRRDRDVGRRSNHNNSSSNNSHGNNNNSHHTGSSSTSHSAGHSSGTATQSSKDKESGAKHNSDAAHRSTIEINATNFPPLQQSSTEETPIPTPGYKEAFVKYSFDEVIQIVSSVKEANLPHPFNPVLHPFAMTASPNLDLLKRQRTFSIDETREQLVQGRPVQREAVISGAVDYRSLMYGDENVPSAAASSNTKPVSGGAKSTPAAGKHDNKTNKATQETAASKTAAAASNVNNTRADQSAVSVTEVAKKEPESKVAADAAPLEEGEGKKDTNTSTSAASTESQKIEDLVQPTPMKITPSTWAAMVKSSAAASTADSSTQTNGSISRGVLPKQAVDKKPKPGSSITAAAGKTAPVNPATAGAHQTQLNGSGTANSQSNSGKEGSDGKDGGVNNREPRRRSDRSSGRDRHGNRDNRQTLAGAGAGKDETANFKENGKESANQAPSSDATNGAVATSWGGKTSFANILKLKPSSGSDEKPTASPPTPPLPATATTVATAATPAAVDVVSSHAPAPAATTDNASNPPTNTATPHGSNAVKSASGHFNNSGHGNIPRKTTAPVEANGVWVKETLPALKASDK